MNSSVKCFNLAWCCIGIFISLLVGIIVGVLFAFNVFASLETGVWIVLAIAVLTLIFVELALIFGAISFTNPLNECLRRGIRCLLIGIFGTIILAIILLSIGIIICLPVIIIVGLLAFFFTLMIISLIALIRCIIIAMRLNT